MSGILTTITGAVTTIATAFLAEGSVLQYVVGFAVVGFVWSRVRKAIKSR